MVFATFITVAVAMLAMPAVSDRPNTELQLMPYPELVQLQENMPALEINRNFSAALVGVSTDRLISAVARLNSRIELQTGFFLTTPVQAEDKVPQLAIQVAEEASTEYPSEEEDESYQLTVNTDQATLAANTPYGALRGLETFLQLIENTPEGAMVPAVIIEDKPRFPWRGALIDCARHFMPLSVVRRQIDGLASAKFNTFHWHLTDDQGWRFESLTYPNLHLKGSDGLYYTQQEMSDIVMYARQYGIRVVPEIDVPGHASSIAAAYPELMAEVRDDYVIERKWGVFEPLLDPSKEEVYEFITQVMGEVASIFPDEYIHIGGDEVNPKQWNESPTIQAFMEANNIADDLALHAYFNARVETILESLDRKMIGWDETYHPDLARSVLIQSWRGHDSLGEAARDGFQGILSTGYYIDQPQAASMHYRNEVMPRALRVDDKVAAGETWETWEFTAPRKRGSEVRGNFTLIHNSESGTRGFIDFSGRSRRAVFDVKTVKNVTSFWMDSWMGFTMPRVVLQNGILSGDILVGNTPYPASGEKIAGSDMARTAYPTNTYPVELTAEEEQLIKGGEVTLWGEIMKEDTIDLRMWPRSYIISERLWSPAALTDADSMYERMASMDKWSSVSVGMQQHWNTYVGQARLAKGMDPRPLQVLAEAVEQAQYYHRHHEKSANENYDQFDPLNRFADTIPPESMQVRELMKQAQTFVAAPANAEIKAEMTQSLNAWIDNHDDLSVLISNNYLLTAVAPVAQHVLEVSQLGLELIGHIETGTVYPAEKVTAAKELLNNAQQIQDELVVSIAHPVQVLLDNAY